MVSYAQLFQITALLIVLEAMSVLDYLNNFFKGPNVVIFILNQCKLVVARNYNVKYVDTCSFFTRHIKTLAQELL